MKWIDNDTRAGPIGVSFLSNIRRSSMGLDEFFLFFCKYRALGRVGWLHSRMELDFGLDWLGWVAKQNETWSVSVLFVLGGRFDLAKLLERRRFLKGDEPGTAFFLFHHQVCCLFLPPNALMRPTQHTTTTCHTVTPTYTKENVYSYLNSLCQQISFISSPQSSVIADSAYVLTSAHSIRITL